LYLFCGNCANLIANEDLFNNETNTEYTSDHNNTLIKNKKLRSNYQPLIMIVTGPLLALFFLFVNVWRSLISYSIRSNRIGSFYRTKHLSTTAILNDISDVLYTRLKSSRPSVIIDADTVYPFDNSITNDDNIQLVSQSINQTNLNENIITEDEAEPWYATLKLPNQNWHLS